MVFYDWKTILRLSKCKVKGIIHALRVLSGEKPYSTRDPLYRYYIANLSGSSYLLNPDKLVEQLPYYKPREIAEYVGLASYRNYANFATAKDTTLDLLHSPVSHSLINKNRLLEIKKDKIHFLFEEVLGEKYGSKL